MVPNQPKPPAKRSVGDTGFESLVAGSASEISFMTGKGRASQTSFISELLVVVGVVAVVVGCVWLRGLGELAARSLAPAAVVVAGVVLVALGLFRYRNERRALRAMVSQIEAEQHGPVE